MNLWLIVGFVCGLAAARLLGKVKRRSAENGERARLRMLAAGQQHEYRRRHGELAAWNRRYELRQPEARAQVKAQTKVELVGEQRGRRGAQD